MKWINKCGEEVDCMTFEFFLRVRISKFENSFAKLKLAQGISCPFLDNRSIIRETFSPTNRSDRGRDGKKGQIKACLRQRFLNRQNYQIWPEWKCIISCIFVVLRFSKSNWTSFFEREIWSLISISIRHVAHVKRFLSEFKIESTASQKDINFLFCFWFKTCCRLCWLRSTFEIFVEVSLAHILGTGFLKKLFCFRKFLENFDFVGWLNIMPNWNALCCYQRYYNYFGLQQF